MFTVYGSRFPSRAASSRSFGFPVFAAPAVVEFPTRAYHPFFAAPPSFFSSPFDYDVPRRRRRSVSVFDEMDDFASEMFRALEAPREWQKKRDKRIRNAQSQAAEADEAGDAVLGASGSASASSASVVPQAIDAEAKDENKNQEKLIENKEQEKTANEAENKAVADADSGSSDQRVSASSQSRPSHPFGSLFQSLGFPSLEAKGEIRLELAEKENEFEVTGLVPGFQKDHLSVRHRDGMLTVSGRYQEEKQSEGQYSRSSFVANSSVALPENADTSQIKAKFEDGKLKIRIAKLAAQEKPKNQIVIE